MKTLMDFRKKAKNSKAIACSVICIVGIVGCGKQDEDKKNTSTTPPPAATTTQTTQHKVELGLISGATVTVYAQDHKTMLYQVKTDNTGVFNIDKTSIDSKIQTANIVSPFVWIEATGGYDLDPNDDGVLEKDEAVALNGKITSIVPYNRLVNEKGFKFNLITSAVADLLSNSDDITQERIDQLSEQLIIPDNNNDGKRDTTDMLRYQMGTFSNTEDDLRVYYLTQIHENNPTGRSYSIDDFKDKIKTVRLDEYRYGASVDIKLFALDKNATIYFSKDVFYSETMMLPHKYKKGDVVTLKDKESIAFQECLGSDMSTCRQRQFYHFLLSNPKSYLDKAIGNNIYTDPQKVKEIVEKVKASKEAYSQAINDVENAERTANYYEEQVLINNKQIADLQEQIRQLQGTGGNIGTPPIVISAPTGLTATPKIIGSTKGIQLSWNAVNNADDYYVFRNGNFLLAQNASSGASFFEFSTVSGTNYCYTVQAVKGSSSPNSNQACAKAP